MSHVKVSLGSDCGFHFSHHAEERLEERTIMSRHELCFALSRHHDIPIGHDKKRGVMHRLVYSAFTNSYAIAVVDMDLKVIITILPLEYSKWVISNQSMKMARQMTVLSYRFS